MKKIRWYQEFLEDLEREYFEIDPVVFRIGFVIIMFVTGLVPAAIGYFACLLVVPKRPKGDNPNMVHVKAEEVKS